MARAGGPIALVAVLALVSAACGGGDPTPSAEGEISEVEQQAGAPVVGVPSADDPSVVRAVELAELLIDRLGDDDTAAGAVLSAGDAGYDIIQIEAGIVRGILAADGTIAGVVPALEPFGRLAATRAMILAQDDLLPIERLRDEAHEEAGRHDYWPVGGISTALILQWQLSGYSQDQIVDMLIFGVETLDDGTYEGEFEGGEEECGGYIIGGVHEIPDFCDPETGELYADRQGETVETTDQPDEVGPPGEGLCGGDFAPPYTLVIEPAGVMLETVIQGPLETPYYYSEVAGFIDIDAEGVLEITANTTRLADITIRGAPDNQVYLRDLELSGTLDMTTGDGEIAGTASGTDQLWSDDPPRPVTGGVSGQVAVLCEEAGIAVFGFATGAGVLEFEARP